MHLVFSWLYRYLADFGQHGRARSELPISGTFLLENHSPQALLRLKLLNLIQNCSAKEKN